MKYDYTKEVKYHLKYAEELRRKAKELRACSERSACELEARAVEEEKLAKCIERLCTRK